MNQTTRFEIAPKYVPARDALIRKNRVIGRWHWEVNEELRDTNGRKLPIAVGSAATWQRAVELVQTFLDFDSMRHQWRHG